MHTALALPSYAGSAMLPSGQQTPKLDERKALTLLYKTYTLLNTKEQGSFKKQGW